VGRLGKQPPSAFLSPDKVRTKVIETETRDWEQTAAIIARFFEVKAEDFS
jgi:hypothetical protein